MEELEDYIPEATKSKGFSGEIKSYSQFLRYGLSEFIVYKNSLEDYEEWKHTLQKGVDFIIETPHIIYLVENAYCSYHYTYRTSWFLKSRVPRFEHALSYQRQYLNGKPIIRIVLTNKPENFKLVTPLAESHGIFIMDVNTLISYIDYLNNILNTNNTSNNVYSSENNRESNAVLDLLMGVVCGYNISVNSHG